MTPYRAIKRRAVAVAKGAPADLPSESFFLAGVEIGLAIALGEPEAGRVLLTSFDRDAHHHHDITETQEARTRVVQSVVGDIWQN